MNDEAKAKYLAAIEAAGLTMMADFVPFSQSRNAGNWKGEGSTEGLTLNWKVTILKATSDHSRPQHIIIREDYAQGVGHIPGFRHGGFKNNWDRRQYAEAIKVVCETGRDPLQSRVPRPLRGGKIQPPALAEVLGCLLSDASAIDHPTYESWASDLGYDPDSRKGEAIYRACLETGLKLRAALGDETMSKLRDLCCEAGY